MLSLLNHPTYYRLMADIAEQANEWDDRQLWNVELVETMHTLGPRAPKTHNAAWYGDQLFSTLDEQLIQVISMIKFSLDTLMQAHLLPAPGAVQYMQAAPDRS